ncbi:MAG: DUF695 domain-containing protein [Corynebacteriales bacterium]|nr:DUF695 domain-containing protein [Mycobacteriales bacterium]
MSVFRWRRRDPKAATVAFWSWWPSVAAPLASAMEADPNGPPKKLRRELEAHVEAIHPELTWELLDGTLARHSLVLSAEGAPELRILTERWRRAGPGDDLTWEFAASRPPNPAAMHSPLHVGRRTLKPLDARFGVETDAARGRIHVKISHPDLPYLQDAERLWFTFLLLDWVLGEDDVERWIGEVRFSADTEDLDGPGLRRAVTELSRELGSGQWAHLEGLDAAGRHATVLARIPFPRQTYPLFDAHCAITIPLLRTPQPPEDEITALAIAPPGPDEAELEEVDSLTRVLTTLLGDSALLAAVETVPDARTLHLYADSESVVSEQIKAWVQSQSRRDIAVRWRLDPGWEKLREFV